MFQVYVHIVSTENETRYVILIPHSKNPHDGLDIGDLFLLSLLLLALLDCPQISLRVNTLRSLLH